jgi:putative ABC transport system permease protein
MIDSVTLTVRHSLRLIRRTPAFVVLAATMLTLGIASTTAVFSLIKGVLLTPPPYEEPERLVFVSTASVDNRDVGGLFNWPQELWEEWLADSDSFESIAGYRWVFSYLVLGEGSESLEGMMVSEGYFSVVGATPALGRAFLDSDSDGTGGSAIILGHDLWVRRFDGDPGVVGRSVRLSGQDPRTVVGVMPSGVRFLPSPSVSQEPNYDLHAKVDYWMPIPRALRERPAWNVIGRLRPGASPSSAEAEVRVILAREAEANPALEGLAARMDPLASVLNAEGRRVLLLLIACGNATALLLIRGLRRQHEYGLRVAIGAGRAQMFRLVIAESLVLACLSGGAGLALALGIVRLFELVGGNAIPRLEDVTIGWPVVGFGFGAAAIACLVAGLAPALRAASLNPVDALRLGGPKSSEGRAQRRLLSAVVIGQTALTLALLVGAGLLIRTIVNLDAIRAGYDTRNILTMSVTSVEGDWQGFHSLALERVAALPGVEGAAFAWGVPLTGNAWPNRIQIEGYVTPNVADDSVALPMRAVTPGYFDLLGQPITAGRDFRANDGSDAPGVAIVNEAFVERYFAGSSAIGREVWPGVGNESPSEIVGVIADSRTSDLTQPAEPELYLPLWQAQAFSKHLVVRTLAAPEAIATAVRTALRDIAPTVAVENVKTLDEIRGQSMATRTFAMQLLIGFAAVACALTLGGVYSVLSLSVAARRREIAIRSAVGAERRTIFRLVMTQGVRLLAAGAIVGVLAAAALASLLQALLFGVDPTDPATMLGAASLFVVAGLLACWAPAYRAAAIAPVEALKAD